jgi:hypothetical protein
MFLMFEEKTNKVAWTLLVFFGWLLVAFSSQIFSINDATITVIRHMADLRLLRVIIVIVGYSLLVLFKYDWKKIIYLFFVGFLTYLRHLIFKKIKLPLFMYQMKGGS